jgi:hypothetical protein
MKVVTASDVILGSAAGRDVLAVTSLPDEMAVASDARLRGVAGQDAVAAAHCWKVEVGVRHDFDGYKSPRRCPGRGPKLAYKAHKNTS